MRTTFKHLVPAIAASVGLALATLPAAAAGIQSGVGGAASGGRALGAILDLAAAATVADAAPARSGAGADTKDAPLSPPGTAAAEQARPQVYWYGPGGRPACDPQGGYVYGLDRRLDAARATLDDSARFPPGPPVGWRYDPATGSYYYFSGGDWHLAGRETGWFDHSGQWHPDPARSDGRHRPGVSRDRYFGRGAWTRPIRPAPCPCEDW